MIRHVLVAVDGSEHAERALDLGCWLANSLDAKLSVMYVVRDAPRIPPGVDEYGRLEHLHVTQLDVVRSVAEHVLADAERRAKAAHVVDVETVAATGRPAKEIVEYAEKAEADVIVLGRRGLGDVGGLLLGSVSHKVGHLAESMVMTVK